MGCRWCIGVFALALGVGLAGAMPDASSQIIDMGKYPAMAGGWGRSEAYQWSRGEKPPLTPEYQAVYDASLADRAKGGHGTDTMYRCFPPGMPRQMLMYSPMEIVITPGTTYMLIDHIHDDRRIFTDGRAWPEGDVDPTYSGYSIGKWVDQNGSGKYDALEVETRFIKGPRTLDGLLPTHEDNQTIVKERIYLDQGDNDILHDEITTIDHALTRPWTVDRTYLRERNSIWPEKSCYEANNHIVIGPDQYFLSADGKLMPVRQGQPPPDLKYFKEPPR
jgi:hypothetical protein